MKKTILIITSLILGVIAAIILACIVFYNVNLKAVSNESTEVEFMVDSGSTYYNVISKLKDEKKVYEGKDEVVYEAHNLSSTEGVKPFDFKIKKRDKLFFNIILNLIL